jgi:leader peptidase (prepilin peptidase)/N-methyltransferase
MTRLLDPVGLPIEIVGVVGVGIFLFGLIVGSLLNVVIHRLPRGESVVSPRSRCPHCGVPIRGLHNIPLFSYAFLRGRCAGCSHPISIRYPAVELLTACVFAAFFARYGLQAALPVWFFFAATLITAAAVDLEHQLIPDEFSLGGLFVGLLAAPGLAFIVGGAPGEALRGAAVGAALGAFVLWSVGFLHARVSTALGRRFDHWPGEGEALPSWRSLDYWIWFPGIGFGDVKLLAMIGAFLGALGVLETIVAASFLGLLVGGLLALRRGASVPFGFGPSLAAGAVFVALVPLPVIGLP